MGASVRDGQPNRFDTHKPDPALLTTLDRTTLTNLEINRRAQAQRITKAMKSERAGVKRRSSLLGLATPPPRRPRVTFREPPYRPEISQMRAWEIESYLRFYRRELALDSMELEMDESQFLWYLNEQLKPTGNQVTHAELRGFFQKCQTEGRLFTWREFGDPP